MGGGELRRRAGAVPNFNAQRCDRAEPGGLACADELELGADCPLEKQRAPV